jgi:hypothetical protein
VRGNLRAAYASDLVELRERDANTVLFRQQMLYLR